MTVIRCQMCGKMSSDELEICPFCQARLTPLQMPSSDKSADEFDLGDQPDELFSTDRIGILDSDTTDGTSSEEEITPSDDEFDSSQNPAEMEVKEWLSSLDDEEFAEIGQSKLSMSDSSDKDISSDDEDDWIAQFRQDDQSADMLDEKLSDDIPGDDNSDGLTGWLQNFNDGDESDSQSPSLELSDMNLEEQNSSMDRLDLFETNLETPDGVGEPELPELDDDADSEMEKNLEALEDDLLDDAESPDWLKNLQAETRTFIDETQQEGSISPDWMTDLEAGTSETHNTDDPEDREIPAWLRDIGADPLTFDENITSSSDLQESVESEISDDQADTQEPGDSPTDSDLFGSLDLPLDGKEPLEGILNSEIDPEEVSIIDSLLDDNQPLFVESSSQQSQSDEAKTAGDSMPEWLRDISSMSDPTSSDLEPALEDQSIEDVSGELQSANVPEWLAELKTDGASISEELMDVEEAKELDASLQEELPEWVQDLQPVESMLSQDGVDESDLDQYVESSGPLAGLRGVLPAAAGVASQHQSNIKRDPSSLSPDQNQQVEMINKLLESESEPMKVSKPGKKNSQQVLRWVVALLMIVAVVLPQVIGFPLLPSASNYPPELLESRQIIFDMAYSAPVLLIFDYEPAYSAELEAAASAVVIDLINKDSRLIIVSTSPTGTVLSNHFLGIVRDQEAIQREIQVAELGYLAGGARGIALFANDPSLALPYSTDGELVWETQALQDVHDIKDFSVVLLLTENPDTARDWIEQAGGYLGDTPFLMVISAQAEPLIRPYYESGQVAGLVTGLAGGKTYEQTLNTSGLGDSFWNSFGSGLFMIEIIILIAGLWSLIALLLNRKPGQKEEV